METLERISLEDPRDFLEWRRGSGDTIEIYDIVVMSDRRKGKGRQLINLLLDTKLPIGTRLVWAITRSDNWIAQQFYEELHFRVVGVLRDFYRDQPDLKHTVDAIMYGLDIGRDLKK